MTLKPSIQPCRLSPVCVLANRADCPNALPPHQNVRAPRCRNATKSTHPTLLSDEPFSIRDIQFDNPQIRVLRPAPIQPFIKLLFVFRSFRI